MARRRSSSPGVVNRPIYRAPVRLPQISIVRPRVTPKLTLRVIEDRRTFHPLRDARPVLTFSRRDQRRIVEKSRSVARASRDPNPFPALRLGFAVPEKVAVCVRRKQRRESLFAFKRTGKGSRSRRRITPLSRQHC